MNRRQFFRLGVGGLGLAAGSGYVTAVEQIPSKPLAGNGGHPWWVRRIDKPKLAIDDRVYSRFDPRRNVFGSFVKYYGLENLKKLRRRSREKTGRYYREKRPGYRLEDRALADAAWVISRLGGINRGTRSWTRQFVSTPEERGVERYTASPQEASRLVKAAARYFGAARAGTAVLDRRHIYSHLFKGKGQRNCL
ncbi:MAG: reductive dehalogenase domain-containing protein [Candidatus Aminicenantales bacterium]